MKRIDLIDTADLEYRIQRLSTDLTVARMMIEGYNRTRNEEKRLEWAHLHADKFYDYRAAVSEMTAVSDYNKAATALNQIYEKG